MSPTKLSRHELANLVEPSPTNPQTIDAELDAQVQDCHCDGKGGPEAFFVDPDTTGINDAKGAAA
ncbi:hypothetical protein HN358_04430 [Candidatus Uhrbacteria bacterium]|jgi:hypothetical protein|nr:hypothetical protein [Candidatus Uhrbacteria bacterium]MBT7717030.1 hypothetical protein [Candidatus Uhrbacteria bacterium]